MLLGQRTFDSPLQTGFVRGDELTFASPLLARSCVPDALSFECSGPERKLFFDPTRTTAGVVSCGGLAPGINDVVRSIVLELHHAYGVRRIHGFRYGLEGLTRDQPTMALTVDAVRDIHRLGGSILGASRGPHPASEMVDALVRTGTDVLFMIGGNGTMRAARSIVDEITRRRCKIAVVVLPKTIDDDIAFIDKSFGFDTAVERARDAIDAAHAEAASARNGIAVVKLMGRDAGFVTASAALASGEANFVLLPEVPFDTNVLLTALDQRLHTRGHAVIVVAEGCAKQFCADGVVRDASGNARYVSRGLDVGPALCDAIERHFEGREITLKYIDPSYTIRAARAIASDAIYGAELARHAVHAAMAGHTDVTVGRCHGVYVRLPLELVVTNTPVVTSELRGAVREHTGQFEENQHARP